MRQRRMLYKNGSYSVEERQIEFHYTDDLYASPWIVIAEGIYTTEDAIKLIQAQ